MKLRSAIFVGPLVMIVAAACPMAQASPAETTPGTVTPSPATMAAPVPPMSAAEAAATTAAPSVPSSAAASASAAAPVAALAAPAPAMPEAKSAESETFAIRKTARELGLKPRTKNGTEVYCKSFAEIGTNLATLNCYTKDQVAELQKRTQSNQDDVKTMQRDALTERSGG